MLERRHQDEPPEEGRAMKHLHTQPPTCDSDEISLEDERKVADRETKRVLGISFAEFERRWRSGTYRSNPDPKIIDLAFYLR
jgi:hypothetical protein